MTRQQIVTLILLLSPVILVQLGLAIYSLVDLAQRAQTRGPRWAWALGLALTCLALPTGIIVSGFYLSWGRHGEA